jgi:hypothetical protein
MSRSVRDEQLLQLFDGVTYDGDLISKDARNALVLEGLADRTKGYNFLTCAGVQKALIVRNTVVWHQVPVLNPQDASRRCG